LLINWRERVWAGQEIERGTRAFLRRQSGFSVQSLGKVEARRPAGMDAQRSGRQEGNRETKHRGNGDTRTWEQTEPGMRRGECGKTSGWMRRRGPTGRDHASLLSRKPGAVHGHPWSGQPGGTCGGSSSVPGSPSPV
jgi:hypothetical protein